MTENQNTSSPPAAPESTSPWWREPVMWWVVGGPSLVVVASFVTLGLALRYPDPVLDKPVANKAMQPAKDGRNHAATGGK